MHNQKYKDRSKDPKVYKSKYKDQNAITLESNLIKAQIIPEIGSKICSLIYKPKDIELLIQREDQKYKLEPYDGVYINGEESGFDEMFPSINECYYESYPWKGIRIPDHGELWSIPWDYKIENYKLIMEVYGVRFPYKIKKAVCFTEENILKIEYELTNLSNFTFDFMWAAHTMFILEENSEIVLPKDVKKVISTWRFGNYGDEYNWPCFESKSGEEIKLNKIRSKIIKDAKKYFVKGKMPEGWCAVKYFKSEIVLALSFPTESVPYLAILTNEGGWEDLFNIFIEPCTASFDRLDVARLREEYISLGPKSKFEWHLNFTISEIMNFRNVSEEGLLI